MAIPTNKETFFKIKLAELKAKASLYDFGEHQGLVDSLLSNLVTSTCSVGKTLADAPVEYLARCTEPFIAIPPATHSRKSRITVGFCLPENIIQDRKTGEVSMTGRRVAISSLLFHKPIISFGVRYTDEVAFIL